MATKQVHIPDIGPVTLYKRRGNRSLRLSVGLNGEVRVSLPYWVPYKAAEEFAKGKMQWIAAHQDKHSVELEHGMHVGKSHRVFFERVLSADKITTHVTATDIRVTHPASLNSTHPTVQAKAHAASLRALRKEAEQLLPQRLKTLAWQNGFTYTSVGVKQLKSRWGSCSSNQEIILNLFLMQLPWSLIDYVLMHELTHTKVMQHGQPFWEELEKHMPNAKALKREINTHQPVLSPKAHAVA